MFERGPQGRSVRSLVWQNKTMTNDVCHLMQQRQGDVGRRKQSDSKSPDDDGRRILFYDNGKDANRRILFKDGQKLRRVSDCCLAPTQQLFSYFMVRTS
jgi:hypothetical protein